MAFVPKDWRDYPDTSTPLSAAAIEDLEVRVTDYTDDEIAAHVPNNHASRHAPGGADPLDITKIFPSGAVLPTLPDPLYPTGALFYRTTDTRLVRSNGSSWASVLAPPMTTSTPLAGLASARPAANARWGASLYVATDTGEVSQTDGTSTWTTLGFVRRDAPVTASEQALYFDFTDTTTFARGWTVATGTTPTVSGGVATPVSAAEVKLNRVSEMVGDQEVIAEIVMPGSITAGQSGWSILPKWLDSSNHLMTRWYANGIEIWKFDGGSYTSLIAPAAIPAPTPGATYWMVSRVLGNTVTVEWWTTDPAKGGSPATTLTYTLAGGDATKFGAGVRGRVGLRHSTSNLDSLSSLIIRPLSRPPRQRDVQVFTSSGTWTKPPGAAADPNATCRFIGVGHGGPGGSGARRASGVVASGGAGGGGGGVFDFTCDAADAPATATVVYGAAPVAPAGVTTNDTNGSAGTAGGTCFVSSGSWSMNLAARAGSAGAGGQAGATATAGAGGSSQWNGGGGGQGSNGNAGAGSGSVAHGSSGGGGGGGIGAGPTAFAGGNGSGPLSSSISTIAGGAATGANGTAGGSVSLNGTFLAAGAKIGCGGGGGGASTSGAGGNGGAGGNYGGGGGGGGCSLNGSTSGAGGNGAPAIIIIVTEWGG